MTERTERTEPSGRGGATRRALRFVVTGALVTPLAGGASGCEPERRTSNPGPVKTEQIHVNPGPIKTKTPEPQPSSRPIRTANPGPTPEPHPAKTNPGPVPEKPSDGK